MKRPMTVSEMAKLGGRARAKKLSKARRQEIARMGGLAKAAKGKRDDA